MGADFEPPRTDEAQRVATLHALDLIDAGPERELDALVALAARMLGCPAALVNLVDGDKVWVKASTVAAPPTFPRARAFCDLTLRVGDLTVIDDLTLDTRFADLPLVTEPGGPRFYAGVPLHVRDECGDSQPIGTLCVLSDTPRSLADGERGALLHLATLAEALIGGRATARRAVGIARDSAEQALQLARKERVFRQAERMAMIGSWRFSLEDERLDWSDNVYRIHGLQIGTAVSVIAALDHYPPEARGRVSAALAHTIATGEPFDFEEDFVTAQAEPRRVRSMGECETVDGRTVAMVGVFRDVTEQHALETRLRRSADTDALTGLPNRAAFERSLDRAMMRARATGSALLLALIDLDDFKSINDTLGHLAGDDVLRDVGRALRAPWLGGSGVARLGGDEFAVVVEESGLAADLPALRHRLEETLRVPVAAQGLGMIATGTVGLAAFDPDFHSVRDFVHHADMMLYAAKRERVVDRRRGDRRAG